MVQGSRRILVLAGATVAVAGAALGAPPPGDLGIRVEARSHDNRAWLGRYRDSNAELIASGRRVDVAPLGAILQRWYEKVPGYFREGARSRPAS